MRLVLGASITANVPEDSDGTGGRRVQSLTYQPLVRATLEHGVREPVAPFYGPVVREQRISLSLIEIPKTRNLLAPRAVGITPGSAFIAAETFFTSQFSLGFVRHKAFPDSHLQQIGRHCEKKHDLCPPTG